MSISELETTSHNTIKEKEISASFYSDSVSILQRLGTQLRNGETNSKVFRFRGLFKKAHHQNRWKTERLQEMLSLEITPLIGKPHRTPTIHQTLY